MQEYFKIGELSRLYGIGVDTLRYYEKIGILHPERSPGGYRHYSVDDIWKLNIIRDLRGLGFGMEQIREYLRTHSVDTTLKLLEQEQQAIREKIAALKELEKNVSQRLRILRAAEELPMDQIALQEYPDRRCHFIPEGYSEEHEMDVLIKRLINMDKAHLYVIGSNQIGTVLSREEARQGKLRYQSVFVIDDRGQKLLPGGTYLTVTYRGQYGKSLSRTEQLFRYAEENQLQMTGPLLELLWIDIHTSADPEEYITQLQIRVEEQKIPDAGEENLR